SVKQVLRDAGEEAFQQVHGQRKLQTDIHQGETQTRVVQIKLHQHLEQRDQDDLWRKDDGTEQGEVHEPVATKVVACQAVSSSRTEQGHDGHGCAYHQRAVPEILRKVGVNQGGA